MADKYGIDKGKAMRVILDDFFRRHAHLFDSRDLGPHSISSLDTLARLRSEPTVSRSFVIFDEHTILLEAMADMYGLTLYEIVRLAINDYFDNA